MRKTEYISHEFNRSGVSADRQETEVYWSPIAIDDEELVCDQRVWADYCNELFQVGNKIKKNEGEHYRDREMQIRAIEKTFNDVSFRFSWEFAMVVSSSCAEEKYQYDDYNS